MGRNEWLATAGLVVAAVFLAACDPPIALAGDTTLTVAVPLPPISRPEGAPELVATLEVPGFLGEVKLIAVDDVASGSFAFAVPSARSVAATVRVSGALRPGDDEAVLAIADLSIDVGPGLEATLDATNVGDDAFFFAPSVGRPWLDLNRNDLENRADFEAGCDPAVPARFLGVSATDLQLPRDQDRAVVIVDNLLPRRIHLRVDVIDAPGVGVDVVGDAEAATSLPSIGERVLEPGESLLIAVSFAAPNAFFSSGFLDLSAVDDVDAGACGTRLAVPVRVLANVGTPPRPALDDAPAPLAGDVGGFPAELVTVPSAAVVASGTPFVTNFSATPSGRTVVIDGAVVAADAVFLVEIPRGGRLSAAVSDAPFDLDLTVLALDDDDKPVAVLPLRPEALEPALPLPAGSIETAEVRYDAAARGRDVATSRVLVVVGASGVTEPRLLDVGSRSADVSITVRTSTTPRLIARAEPASGPVDGDTTVTLVGESLSSSGVVFFGRAPALCAAPVDDGAGRQRLSCTTPAGTLVAADNPVDVVYVSSAAEGSERAVLVDAFLFEPTAPRIDSVSPAAVVVGSVTAITVTGFGFTERYAPVEVTIGGTRASADVVDDRTLFAIAPAALAAGPKDLSVTVFSSSLQPLTTTVSDAFAFVDGAVPAPVLSSIGPSSGDVAGGTQVTLTGSGFAAGATVTFGGENGSVVFVGGTAILVISPAAAPGAVDVVVTNPDLQADTLDDAFTFTDAALPPTPPPQAFTLVPSTGSTAGGEEVTILGADFDEPIVSFDGAPVVVVNAAASAIVVRAPAHAAGLVDVTVENADGQRDVVVAGYSFVAPVVPGPQVFSISPQTGPLAGGTVVTLLGTSFSIPAVVSFGGVVVTPSSNTANAIVFTAPAHVAGAVDVVVTNLDGQSARVQGAFVYADPVVNDRSPLVVTLTPDPAHADVGGESLRLVGQDLGDTAGATVVAGGTRIPAVLASVSQNVVVVTVATALPAGTLVVELVDPIIGVHTSPLFQARSPVPIDLSVGGRADEGSAFTLLVDGSDLNPARLVGVRFTPLDAGSGSELVLDTTFASESIIAVDVADDELGRGGWIVALVYEEADGDDVIVPVDVLEVGGFCPGARLCETCGDAIRDPGEGCDTADFNGETCQANGFDGGLLICSGCQLDFNLCSQCGNGRKETGEQCDNADLGAQSCTNAGFAAGTLGCLSTCQLDVSQCRTCGDGVCSLGETSANCAADCVATCGNGSCNTAAPDNETCHTCPRDCSTCAPYTLVVVGGDQQSAPITGTLTDAITVRLVDDLGAGVPGVPITFGIEPGDATSDLDFIVTTDASGTASLSWSLGPRLGLHTMTLTANPADGSAVANLPLIMTATADDVDDGTIVRLVGGSGSGFAILNSGIRSRMLAGGGGMTVDDDGNPIYLDVPGGNSHLFRLRMPDGVIETIIPGNGAVVAAGGSGDGGLAINAKVRFGAALSTRGDELFVIEGCDPPNSDRVRRIDAAGVITTVAGGGANGQPANGDGGPATAAHFEQAQDLGFDFNGDLVVIDNGTGRFHMRRVVAGGISTFTLPAARTGTNFAVLNTTAPQVIEGPLQFFANDLFAVAQSTGTGGFATNAHLTLCDTTTNACMVTRGANVVQIARGPDGLLYTATTLTIERHDGFGGRSVIAGTTQGFSGDGGPATAAQFSTITAISFNAAGDLFIMDAGVNNALRMIRGVARPTPTPPATSFSVIDGDQQSARIFGTPAQPARIGLTTTTTVGEWPMLVRGGTGGQAAQPSQVAFTNPQIPQAINPLLGRALGEQRWFVEAPLPLRRLLPAGVDPATFVVDATPLEPNSTLVVNSSPLTLGTALPPGTTIAASRLDFGSLLGSGTQTEPSFAFRGSEVFLTDPPQNVVWRIDADGAVTALAGSTKVGGTTGDGAAASLSLVTRPAGVSIAGTSAAGGDVLFTDTAAHRIRRVRASDGVIVNAAGTGSTSVGGGNGSPAIGAILNAPRQVLGRPDGSFFLTDTVQTSPGGVRFVDVDGVLRNVMADGTCLASEIKANSAGTSATLAFNPITNRVLSSIHIPNAGACPIGTSRFHIMDITNGVLSPTPVFSEASPNSGILPVSMAIHPIDGRIVLITTNIPGQAANYVMRQLVGATLTTVPFPGVPYAMAFDDDGTLWVVDQINKTIVQMRF
ncbi:MAG: IPT/TIG domain-containing protein [Deltaproteobacteria bacterium]|nr:IPT/TIG domain-containing protein [Deltaproteobacteria bacterium]